MKLPKLTPYQKSKIRKNLRTIFESTSKQERTNGKNWYKSANELCKEIQHASGFNQSLEQIAGVIAALSPRNKWERNILDAQNVLMAVNNNLSEDTVKVCTFNKNKQKAFNIAKGIEAIKTTSKKTFAFVQNIGNLNADKVTVDLWHLRACFGSTITTGLTPKIYDEIERITISEAQKVGLKGFEYQAVIWEKIRV